MIEHCLNLLTGNAWKPFEKIINTGTVFEVFEERLNRNSRAFERPGTTDLPGVAFHGGAF